MGTALFPSRAYAEYAAGLQFSDLPPDVVESCKLILLDSIGTAAAASGVISRSNKIVSYAGHALGAGESALWGYSDLVSPMAAAFANGALAHALNYDVLGAGYAGLIPSAVLAAADCANEPTSGRDVVTALAVGIELGARIQDAVSHIAKTYDRIIDGQLQTYFSCAVAAAKVMRLPADLIDNALGLALMQAAGSMQVTLDGDPEAKAYYGGFPNQAGLQSALLARGELQAACNAFSGKAGLFPLFYDVQMADDALLSGLADRYLLRRVRFKRWPCSAAFSELMAVAYDIKRVTRLRPDDIARIEIVTSPTMRVWFEPSSLRRAPQNAAAAGNSAPFTIATILANGDFTLSDLTQDGLTQPSVLQIASRIEVRFHGDLNESSKLIVTTTQGVVIERDIEASSHSKLPWLNAEGARIKFKQCLDHAHDKSLIERANEIADLIESLDELADFRQLNRVLAGSVWETR